MSAQENHGISISGGTVRAGAMAAGANAVAHTTDRAAPWDAPEPDPGDAPDVPAPAAHRTILVADIAGFSDRRRTDVHQLALRDGLTTVLRRACERSGIPWRACHREDTGDGAIVLAPPEVPKQRFAESLPHELAAALREHNAVHDHRARIRLRVALHAGEVRFDAGGVIGHAVIHACRLVDADVLRARLATAPPDDALALIVSDRFHEDVVRHSAAADPASYREVRITVKETTATAWLRATGQP
jgi:hypothetical protein